jgi:hypothetical protein
MMRISIGQDKTPTHYGRQPGREAGMYLNLCDIAAGECKFSWDRMFQDAILRHSSKHPAKFFSQRLCKFNLALNELQVALGLGKQVSRRGLFSCNYYLFYSPELISPPQAAMPAATTHTFKTSAARRMRFCSKQRNQPSQDLDPSVL